MERAQSLNRIITILVLTLALPLMAVAQPAGAARLSGQTMTVKIVGMKIRHAGVIEFRLAIGGMKLDAADMGKHPVGGHGHVQYYLNTIPSDAHRRPDSKNLVASVAAYTYTLSRKTSKIKIPRGRHMLYIALAQNNNVLYKASPAMIAIVMP